MAFARIDLMNMGRWTGKKLSEYCRRLKQQLANLMRSIARSKGQDRLAFKARAQEVQREFEELCPKTDAA